jgi:hypothetical protein
MRRRILRLLSVVGAAFLAMFISLAMVVTTPSTAHALVETVNPPTVFGKVKTLAPKLILGGMKLHPAGFMISNVAGLAMMAYETRDSWLPYVTGAIGTGTEVEVSPSALVDQFWQLDEGGTGLIWEGRRLWVRGSYTNPDTKNGVNRSIAAIADCRNTTSGAVTRRTARIDTVMDTDLPRPMVAVDICSTGETGIGALAGAPSAHPTLPSRVSSGTGTYAGPNNLAWTPGWAGAPVPDNWDPRSGDTQYIVTSKCVTADGTTSEVKATTNGDVGALKIPSCAAAGQGLGTGETTVDVLAPGTTAPERIYETKPDYSTMPLCDPAKGNTSGCIMEIELDGKPCEVGVVECEQWAEINNSQPERVKCKLGPYTMNVRDCGLLERAYTPGGAPATEQNTDGDPGTRSNRDPNGVPITSPAPTTTGTGTGTSPVPGGAGQTGAGADQDAKQCFPTGWAVLNPVEWVMKPVGCALSWAFVPKQDAKARIQSMGSQFSNKVPMTWFGVGLDPVSGGSCPTSWKIDYKGESYSLICGTAADGIIQTFRPVLGGMLVLAAVWPLMRSLFYSSIPVLKVTPS